MRMVKVLLPLLALFILAQLVLIKPLQTHGSEQSLSTVTVSGLVSGPGGPVDNVRLAVGAPQDWQETTTAADGSYSVNIETDGELWFHLRPDLSTRLAQINQSTFAESSSFSLNFTLQKGYLISLTPTAGGSPVLASDMGFELQPLTNPRSEGQWFNMDSSGENQPYQAVLPPDIYYVRSWNTPAGYYPTTKPFDLRSGDQNVTLPLSDSYVHPIPYDPPDASKIILGAVDDLGEAAVVGAPGAALPLAQVLLVNLTSTHQAQAVSEADGSFAARIYAPPGSAVMVKHGPASERWADLDMGLAEGVNPFPGTIINVPHTHSAADGQLPFAAAGAVESTADDPGDTRNTVSSAWAITGAIGPVIVDGQWTREFDGKYEGQLMPGLYLGGLNWTHPALGDLDNDQDLELLVGESSGQLVLYRNQGGKKTPDWQFETIGYAGVDTGAWAYPALVDVTNDGAPDLFVGTGGGLIQIYYNTGTPASPSWPSSPDATLSAKWDAAPALADLDDDGDLDLVAGHGEGSLLYFRNSGTINNPNWSAQPGAYGGINEPGHGLQPGFVDLDGDDDLDLLIGRSGDFVWYRNKGPANNPAWARVTDDYMGFGGSSAVSPGLGDWDDDGDADLVTGEHWGRLNFFRNDGPPNWTWQDKQFPFELDGGTTPALADWNNDGDLDMLIGQAHGNVHQYSNKGSKTAADWQDDGLLLTLPWTDHPRAFPAFADIDNDNAPDLFIGEGGWQGPGAGGNIHYYHNDGSPTAPNWKLVTTDFLGLDVGSWSRPAFVDIDDDNDLDLFVGAKDGSLTFVKNTGSATVPAWATPAQPYAGLQLGAYSAPSFIDVDEDGDLDMLVGLDHGSLAYVRNTGSASSPAWEQVTNQYPGIDVGEHAVPTTADIDGDGKDDLLIGNEGGGVSLYLYAGPGASRTTNSAFDPGDLIQIKGKIRLHSYAIDGATDVSSIGAGGNLNLMAIANSAGEPLSPQNSFMSTLLTPSGFPIQGGQPSREYLDVPVQVSNLQYRGGHTVEGDIAVTTSLPADLPAGTYRPLISLGFENVPASEEWLAANVTSGYTYRYEEAILPPLTVGQAKEPRLIWRLMMDDFVQGTRGAAAEEDAGTFELSSQIVSQGADFYIPRVDLRSKEPIVYRLEPFLPMISFTDRRMPAPPLIPFALPGGQLCVKVRKPDNTTKNLGCEALAQSFNRTKTTRGGVDLNNGTVQIEDVYSLMAASDRFRLAFDQYGKHTVTMSGTVKDLWGNSYSGGGTYELWIAEPLDIDAGVLPGTPLAVGDAFNPALQFYPQVPAQVTINVTHYPESDLAQKEVHTISGQANAYGYFNVDGPAIVLSKPGEFRVDVTANYTAVDGRQHMGAMTWGGIVMTDANDAQLIAHGRRGMDSLDYIPNHWFVIGRDLTIPPGAISHILNPYFNGDILWSGDGEGQTVGDSLIMGASIHDTVGTVETAVQTRLNRAWPGLSPPGSPAERFAKGEIPLFVSTNSGRPAQLVPEDVDQIAYSYRTSQRPGVRVREIVAQDSESGGYWRLNTLYDDQLGVGVLGDQPNDFKFQYVGAVYRDLDTGQNEYVGQGSGWIFIPNDDPLGNRVMPPFAGPGNGGWTTEGGPILKLKGKDIHIFILPTGVKPGAVLEVGDTFHFAGHIMPTLNSQVEVTVMAPGGTKHKIDGQANAIGYFYDAADDFVVDRPGLWAVDVKVWHDGLCSGGATVSTYPTGDVLGSENGRYYFYVTPAGSTRLDISSPQPGTLPILGSLDPVTIKGNLPSGLSAAVVDYTISMPGYILKRGQAAINNGEYQFPFDPVALHEDYPNLDLIGREQHWTGLSDTFSIGILLRGKQGNQLVNLANTITIQGDQVYVGEASAYMHQVNLPVILKRD